MDLGLGITVFKGFKVVSKQFQTPEGVPYQSWFQSGKMSKQHMQKDHCFQTCLESVSNRAD